MGFSNKMRVNQQYLKENLPPSTATGAEPFKKKRVPGRLRTSMDSLPSDSSIENLLLMNSSRNTTSTHIYEEMEQIINSLLAKN